MKITQIYGKWFDVELAINTTSKFLIGFPTKM